VEDIREHGLRVPILCDKQGRVIDGRNRQTACVLAGVTPRYETFAGNDEEVLQLVVSLNHTRRHLDKSQLAACAAKADEFIAAARAEAKRRYEERPKGGRGNKVDGTNSTDKEPARDAIGKQF